MGRDIGGRLVGRPPRPHRRPGSFVATRVTPRIVAATVAGLLVAAACTGDDEGGEGSPDPPEPTAAEDSPEAESPPDEQRNADEEAEPSEPEVAEVVATELTTPWGLAFLPDGDALVSERDTGQIKLVEQEGSVSTVGEIPEAVPSSEGGLLGLAVSPSFDEDQHVYAYYSTDDDNRVVRMSYANGSLDSPEVMLDGIPVSHIHNGGRIAFGPDEMLYVATGDANDPATAQDPDSLAGKILRLTPDGEPAPDNPTEASPVWSLGHRNVQGLAWDDGTQLWASEFGSDIWDELNLIEPDGNYGWPDFEGPAENGADVIDPVFWWDTDEASPSGIAHAEGAVWMTALMGERLWRIQLDGEEVVGEPEGFFAGEHGRLRTIETAPDGSLWLVTSNTDGRGDVDDADDQILRLELS